MVDATQTILPESIPVHHLGLFREPTTLQPVEYYNNLPFHARGTQPGDSLESGGADLAIVVDPVIATGGTMVAAIQTLKEWEVKKIICIAVLGSDEGIKRVSEEWPEGVEIWVGGVDEAVNDRGMLVPGLGDIGDRLWLTLGK
jgi:uracil phosphoribosyltransferase